MKNEDKNFKHARAKIGEYIVPLIGIPETSILEECSCCRKELSLIFDPEFPHLELAYISFEGYVYCKKCLG